MSKPEWGKKHTCPSCGAKFYDMLKTPVVCPKCDKPVTKSKAPAKSSAKHKPVATEPAVAVVEVEDEEELLDLDEAVVAEAEDEEEGLIEDASDLGEDDDDMSEVKEHLESDIAHDD